MLPSHAHAARALLLAAIVTAIGSRATAASPDSKEILEEVIVVAPHGARLARHRVPGHVQVATAQDVEAGRARRAGDLVVSERRIRAEEVTPACAQACPSEAIAFGDLNDRESVVHQLAHMDRQYKLLASIGTQPRTTFLGKIRNPNPEIV